jgi:NAD(P)-dependent dehydrogenase (short-subunit alcohol dehydrogenase family)
MNTLASFPPGGHAAVVGAHGGLGCALTAALHDCGAFAAVTGFTRNGAPACDITREDSVVAAAALLAEAAPPLRLVIVASGFLHDETRQPEKSLRDLDPGRLAHSFAVNAIGPALGMKHLLPLLPRAGKTVFAALSARVGSIGDNRLGGWYAYRASKAALNQLLHTAAIEMQRQRPACIVVALHPGTVATPLSAPFAKRGLEVQTPQSAAAALLKVIDALTPGDSGGFFDHRGERVPW